MIYNKKNYETLLQHAKFNTYKKKVNTEAVRMIGPFEVLTSEGPVTCEDGYLAVDARGYPYPIAADEFELIYDEVDESAKKTYNGIAWIGHKTDVKNNQMSITLIADFGNTEAVKFVNNVVNQCDDFVKQDKEEYTELEKDRKIGEY